MKFTMIVDYDDDSADPKKLPMKASERPWKEVENRPTIVTQTQARQWAEETVKEFNRTLRPHEHKRKLIDVEF